MPVGLGCDGSASNDTSNLIQEARLALLLARVREVDVKGMTAPAKSIAYDVYWLAYKKVSDNAIGDLLKVVADPRNLKKLAATAAYWKTLNGDFTNLKAVNIPVHPAAAKYWEGRGFKVPGEIVKGY